MDEIINKLEAASGTININGISTKGLFIPLEKAILILQNHQPTPCPYVVTNGTTSYCRLAEQNGAMPDDAMVESVKHGLACAEIFVIKHCHQLNAGAVLSAIKEAQATIAALQPAPKETRDANS